MRRVVIAMILMSSLIVAGAVTAQVRGRGRLQGVVTDQASGKPIAGATVTLAPAGERTSPIVAKTDRNGKWSALGLTSGSWDIDITADGYEPTSGSAAVSELQMAPPIKSALAAVAVQSAPAETIPVPATPLVPAEAIEAISAGQELLRLKAGDAVSVTTTAGETFHTVTPEEATANAKRAVAMFERALPLVPDVAETAEMRSQLLQVMAQAYYRAGDLPKAISALSDANARDAATLDAAALVPRNMLLVNLYLEQGDLEKGKALLETLPPSAVTDPIVYTNIGILFLNKQKASDAATYFTKAVDLDPKRAESYYYRGLAMLQLTRNKEAKADFQQVIALAPDSAEAGEARQYLKSLK
jgi:regulator of sirC expression with transglutaminase-like and TPR domain